MNARSDLFPLFVCSSFACVFPHSPRNVLRFDEMMSMTFLLCRQSATDEGNTVFPRGRLVCCEESPPGISTAAFWFPQWFDVVFGHTPAPLWCQFSTWTMKAQEWKWFSRLWLFATPWTIQCIGSSRPEYWSWAAFLFSRGSSQPRDWTQVAGGFFTSWATREAQEYWIG